MQKTYRIIVSFSVPMNSMWVVDGINQLAKKEYGNRGRSQLILKALKKYLERNETSHAFPFGCASNENVERESAGIRFLKSQCRLSLRKISAITGWSYGRVQRMCKGITIPPIRVRKSFPLDQMREKWQRFLSGVSPEKAFKFKK